MSAGGNTGMHVMDAHISMRREMKLRKTLEYFCVIVSITGTGFLLGGLLMILFDVWLELDLQRQVFKYIQTGGALCVLGVVLFCISTTYGRDN
jgi:hypothetical protein